MSPFSKVNNFSLQMPARGGKKSLRMPPEVKKNSLRKPAPLRGVLLESIPKHVARLHFFATRVGHWTHGYQGEWLSHLPDSPFSPPCLPPALLSDLIAPSSKHTFTSIHTTNNVGQKLELARDCTRASSSTPTGSEKV